MFIAFANGLRRQKVNRQIAWQFGDGAVDHRIDDIDIDR